MRINLITFAIMMLSGSLSAAELYEPSKHYPTGKQVLFDGKVYETQRWANPGQSPAEITENSWNSPWIRVSEDLGNLVPLSNDIAVTDLEYFEHSRSVDGERLGIESLNITAIEHHQNRIYTTHDTTPGIVLILDANTGEYLGQIDGIPDRNGGISTYRRINEIYIDNNLLYVASLSSNRVDIFDLTNDHQHVMSLGTGSYSGSNSLLHAQAVTTSHDYIFAADASDKIKVYRREDATPENNLRAPQFAYLQFEGKYTHRKVQMHVLDHYLLVQTENKNYYIYDLNKIEYAAQSGVALQPEKRLDVKVQKIDKNGDNLIVNLEGRLEWHNISDVIASDFAFKTPIRTISNLNGKAVGSLKDIHFSNNTLLSATTDKVSIDLLKSIPVTFTPGENVDITQIQFDTLDASSVSDILTLDEPHHILTNPALRSFKVNSPVKTEWLDNDTVQITNYAALELKDIAVELKLHGIDEWFVFAQLDRIPAYTQITLPLSRFGNGQFNASEKQGTLDLSELFNSSMNYTNGTDYRFNSHSDKFAQTLATMKPTWQIQFLKDTHGYWREMNALYAREWAIILTNLAYIVSQPEFEHLWFNFEKIFGYDMYGNAGPITAPGGLFAAEDYQYYYDSLMQRPYVNAGVSLRGGGQGNQWATGIDTWLFYVHYYGEWGIIAHEFGHGFDGKATYHHSSSFADNSRGWTLLATQLANYHIRKGDLPYMDDNINGFYKPEHAAYHHVGVDQKRRVYKYSNTFSVVESYFNAQSDMPQGWLQNGSEMNAQILGELDSLEKVHIAKYSMGKETPYLCKFTFEDGQKYYGHVIEHGNDLRCESGGNILFRRANGSKVTLASEFNEFEWLSLHNPSQSGEAVLHENGQPLCQINLGPFYGTGFVNAGGQCVQLPNIYWSNGSRWLFSSGWMPLKYAETWQAQASESRRLAEGGVVHDHDFCDAQH